MKKIIYFLTVAFLFSATSVMAQCRFCAFGEKGSMSIEEKVEKKMEKNDKQTRADGRSGRTG